MIIATITNIAEIHRGAKIHIQDQLITPVSFRTKKVINKTPENPIPPRWTLLLSFPDINSTSFLFIIWLAWKDSNFHSFGYEPIAFTIKLQANGGKEWYRATIAGASNQCIDHLCYFPIGGSERIRTPRSVSSWHIRFQVYAVITISVRFHIGTSGGIRTHTL